MEDGWISHGAFVCSTLCRFFRDWGGRGETGDGRTANLSTDRQQDLRTARTLSRVISHRRSVRLPRSRFESRFTSV